MLIVGCMINSSTYVLYSSVGNSPWFQALVASGPLVGDRFFDEGLQGKPRCMMSNRHGLQGNRMVLQGCRGLQGGLVVVRKGTHDRTLRKAA